MPRKNRHSKFSKLKNISASRFFFGMARQKKNHPQKTYQGGRLNGQLEKKTGAENFGQTFFSPTVPHEHTANASHGLNSLEGGSRGERRRRLVPFASCTLQFCTDKQECPLFVFFQPRWIPLSDHESLHALWLSLNAPYCPLLFLAAGEIGGKYRPLWDSWCLLLQVKSGESAASLKLEIAFALHGPIRSTPPKAHKTVVDGEVCWSAPKATRQRSDLRLPTQHSVVLVAFAKGASGAKAPAVRRATSNERCDGTVSTSGTTAPNPSIP